MAIGYSYHRQCISAALL